MNSTPDGYELLTGPNAGDVLKAAVNNAGGDLVEWTLDHVDHRPGRSTKALLRTQVRWPDLDGPNALAREELFGVSAHIGEIEKNILTTSQSLVMTDGDINVRVWRYPHDPWLSALAKVCYPDVLYSTLHELGIDTGYETGSYVPVEVVSYRPGRRAVLKAELAEGRIYLKVFQPHLTEDIVNLHLDLAKADIPVPTLLAHAPGLVVLAELPGKVLADEVTLSGAAAVNPAELIEILDRLPKHLVSRENKPAWAESARFYCSIIASALPALKPRLETLTLRIENGLAQLQSQLDFSAPDIVHGDFYEAQIFVHDQKVVGLLDIDSVGPGRRADDLACLLAHLSVLADYINLNRISQEVHQKVYAALRQWFKVFALRSNPIELALRSAAVVLSLATGPHRQQEIAWEESTLAMVEVAEAWVRMAEYGEHYVGQIPGADLRAKN